MQAVIGGINFTRQIINIIGDVKVKSLSKSKGKPNCVMREGISPVPLNITVNQF